MVGPVSETASAAAAPTAWRWPRTLRDVTLLMDGDATATALNQLIATLGHHVALQKLYLQINSDVTLAPLLGAAQLTTLTLAGISCQSFLTDEQLRVVRQLPLARLNLHPDDLCEDATWELLEMDGPPLRWIAFPDSFRVLKATTDHLLLKLPHLTELSGGWAGSPLMNGALVAIAPQLPTLRRLKVGDGLIFEGPIGPVASALTAYSSPLAVTAFSLFGSKFSNAQMFRLLSFMPNLQVLKLEQCVGFGSLTFLQPVAASLRRLRLEGCDSQPQLVIRKPTLLTLAELMPVRDQTALHELDLQSSFDDMIASELAQALQPPELPPTSLRLIIIVTDVQTTWQRVETDDCV